MAVGFGTVGFEIVIGDDTFLPYPVPDENRMLQYTATVQLESQSDYFDLLAYHSTVSVLPAMGGGGLVTIERPMGGSPSTLTIPQANNSENDYPAILTDLSAQSRAFMSDHIIATATWIIVASDDV